MSLSLNCLSSHQKNSQGKCVIVVSHSNCLRAIVKYLNKMTPEQVFDLDIPRAIPLHYQIDTNTLEAIESSYLEDEKVKKKSSNTNLNSFKLLQIHSNYYTLIQITTNSFKLLHLTFRKTDCL